MPADQDEHPLLEPAPRRAAHLQPEAAQEPPHRLLEVDQRPLKPMGWTPPDGIACAKVAGVEAPLRGERPWERLPSSAWTWPRTCFQAHGAAADGSVVFRRKLRRARLLSFFAAQPSCVVAMEACASAHFWGRAIGALGHEVRLIAPSYVKLFVKRQKNDAADAEAIAEAASRPTMRFVAVKTETQQAAATAFRTRDMFVRQRTQTINALRGHLAEHGVIAPAGLAHLGRLAALIEGEEGVLPAPVVALARVLLEQIEALSARIDALEKELRARLRQDETAARLMTIPGVGPICAAALTTFAPPPGTFAKGRDFAAWVGLTPRQHSSGGKERLGKTSKMGEPRPAPPAHHRRGLNGPMGGAPRRARGPEGSWLVARPDAGEEAAHAGRGGSGQPHGARRLVSDGEGRRLPGSGGCGLGRVRRVDVGDVSRAEDA